MILPSKEWLPPQMLMELPVSMKKRESNPNKLAVLNHPNPLLNNNKLVKR
jgi:hypothetical protein